MVNPQCENGYIRFATELWKAICRIRISGESRQIFDVIAQKTYGFNKKEDTISLSQFSFATGITKPNICQALKKLKEMNLITQKDNEIANKYSINKDYTSWKPLPKKITKKNPLPKKQISITQKDNESLPKKLPTIDIIQKTVTKDSVFCLNSVEFQLSELLLNKILERRPTFKKPDLKKWALHVDKMIRLDKRPIEEIEKVIEWCQNDGFWQNNILSTDKLRKQYDQLVLKMDCKKDDPYEQVKKELERRLDNV